MIYGYLRVSTDEQEIESQKIGVVEFAEKNGWKIDRYISDEGVSGGKDPSKRKLGDLLNNLKKGDIIIAAEISRLGRDLYMVMDILHHCMKVGVIIYTVKDRFVLEDDIQSKVLAFAFGLAAEIERQMIRQRTKEGLRLRVRAGVLLGRGFDETIMINNNKETLAKIEPYFEEIKVALKYGCSQREIAKKLGINRNTLGAFLKSKGMCNDNSRILVTERRREKTLESINYKYQNEKFKVIDLPKEQLMDLIDKNLTIPEITEQLGKYEYEQVYDTILFTPEYNIAYRKKGHVKARERFGKK